MCTTQVAAYGTILCFAIFGFVLGAITVVVGVPYLLLEGVKWGIKWGLKSLAPRGSVTL
jgi:hypothetical protein